MMGGPWTFSLGCLKYEQVCAIGIFFLWGKPFTRETNVIFVIDASE